ncbi:MAG: hypothetical protein AAFY71_14650 [Bacteroidota bacterium]
MSRIRTVYVMVALIMASLLSSCSLINGGEMVDPDDNEEALKKMAGVWYRVKSNNPANDGMQLTVVGDQGTITDFPRGGFNVGDVKWRDLLTTGDNSFDYFELGSDGQYYEASMRIDGDTTFITIVSSGAGNIQKWVKEASYTEPDPNAETITLDCNGFDVERVLENGPQEVDYIVPNGCVLDVTGKLTIQPGTVIAFEENAGVGVYDGGSINAVGTVDQEIVLKGMESVKGYWRGIHIETNSINNVFDYVNVSDAGSNYVYCCNAVASVFLKGGKMKVDNSQIANGGGLGFFANASATIESFTNNTITTHEEYPIEMPMALTSNLDGSGSDFSGNEKDFVFITDSDVNDETVVPALNVPYLLEGNVLDVKEALTLEAGVEIAVEENGGIGVFDGGSFKTTGTSSNPVIIRGKEASKGYWRGIHIETNSSNNSIDYAQISDAGSDYVYCCNTIGSLYLKDGKCSITNTTISNGDSYGIATTKDFSFAEFSNNTITTHKQNPAYVTLTQAAGLSGLTSDFTGNDKDQVLLYRNQTSEAVTLEETNVPFRADNNVVLDVTEALTIKAGVTLEFSASAGLGIYDNGSLKAEGTASKRVKFIGAEATSGYWRGIHTETNSSNNVLDYVEIRNAGGNYIYCCNNIANLFLRSGTMTLTNSIISGSDACGVFVRSGATLTESNNTFSDNATGNICN